MLDIVRVGALEVPRAVLSTGTVMLANLLLCALLFKELRISSFDPALATTMGINANLGESATSMLAQSAPNDHL